MHRVIVPLDFSDTSYNAARFTAQMLAGKKDALVILYNNFGHNHEADDCHNLLQSLANELLEKGVARVEFESEMGGDLIENISRLAHTRRATLVVMGITGKSGMRQKIFGSNTLKLVNENLYPVMIV